MMITKKIRKIITGSLSLMISAMMVIMPQAALAASSHAEMSELAEPAGVTKVDAAQGIVRIQSGTTDDDGKFTAKNTFSGFVVSDAGNGGVYIVTTWHSVNTGQNPVIQVTVKNDSTVEASIEAYSSEQDFCILSAGSMKGKKPLPLRIPDYDEADAKDALSDGSTVKALGFYAKAPAGTEFSAADVTENAGRVASLSTQKDNASYVSHSAAIDSGFDGGPLVDENGYVIGVNNASKTEGETFYSLQIKEVDKLLDSNVITHQTRDKDALYASLYALCDESITTYSKVKKAYKDDLKEAIQHAIKVMGDSTYDRAALQSAKDSLQATLDGAELKTSKVVYLLGIFGALIVYLAIRLISLISWNRKYEAGNAGGDAAGSAPAEKAPKKKKKAGKPEKAIPAHVSSAGASVNPAKLTVLRTGEVYELSKNIITIGRSPEADVCIRDNNYVARMHSMIENRKGTYFLHDMGSSNGTYLNGQQVREEGIRLFSGDRIGVANEEIEFR